MAKDYIFYSEYSSAFKYENVEDEEECPIYQYEL